MSDIYSPKRGINVPVISFVTRKLISGYKDEFVKKISAALGVKIVTKSSQNPHVTIKGGDQKRADAAIEVIRQLDQQAQIIADTNVLKTTSSVSDMAYGMIAVHLAPLLQAAVRDLPPLANPEVVLESELPQEERSYTSKAAVPANTQKAHPAETETEAAADDGVWKPKPRALAIKFNDASFKPRNLSQAITYVASRDFTNSYVYAAGPFGGGKTYTPLRAAFEAYNASLIDEIVIIRPTSSTGKDPGAMPGDARRKQDPYLKGGIASNIEKMLVKLRLPELEKAKVVRAFTPDFERGESYDHAFILVDEPQNLTVEQAELIIGRIGEGSIMVFAGDIGGRQNDLKGAPQMSGLAHLLATQGSGTLSDMVLRDATAFIPFRDGDSAARNKILPHVSRALNNPTEEYAAIMKDIIDTKPNPLAAKAVEKGREYAVKMLEQAGLTTLFRYEVQIQQAFPTLYGENRETFKKDRPELKVA